ncbi:MAG TPA: hypothetical protein VK012_05605 [Gemmatimonadales bacterium]|nr:hypothetical protein [Gemmatimonadales bacterium]
MTVYLLHAESPLGHAQHYIGWAQHVSRRLEHHRNGRGARLPAAFLQAGIEWRLARTWPGGDRNLERQLKARKDARSLCPTCRRERRRRKRWNKREERSRAARPVEINGRYYELFVRRTDAPTLGTAHLIPAAAVPALCHHGERLHASGDFWNVNQGRICNLCLRKALGDGTHE